MRRETFKLKIDISRKDAAPIHVQISGVLRELIESGRLAPGTRLEDEVSMARRLQISRPTARKALETLVNLGLIVRRRGAGTEVVARRVEPPLVLTSLYDELVRGGHSPTTSVLDWVEEPATPSIAQLLRLPEGSPVVHIQRLRLINSRPLAILRDYLPAHLAPSRASLTSRNLYDLLREAGAEPRSGSQQIGARLATPAEARLLNEPVGAALLTMNRVAFDVARQPIEVGIHVYRASIYSFNHQLTR
ncbi:GntR family transcriptional regulator [Tessaracoccus sp. OH4464_COT-324]|uniref:GntR family transcriptional regulator n=1 Tax=Tessaracoccus sp. OH4464_COT-324 TaxID=2491059 RepID=UPI000F6348B2|nr:GntR family transcriptional regulator [Tessaracoccus sp. OH4464_COT-324]RRD47191.1 GntR family transcriptional regulator [Tessaracoccus sp. OH4464_COT-324]